MWRSANIPNAWRTALAFRRALALQRAGKGAEAERCCEKVLAREPGHFGALHMLGLAAARQGRLDAALGWLSAATASDPRSAEAQVNRANVLMQLGRPADALAGCDAALALKPGLAEALALRTALRSDLERQVAAHNQRGVALRAVWRYEDALACFDAALAIDPGHAEALNNRCVALSDMGRHGAALESVDRALARKPDFAEAHNNRGIALVALGRKTEALEAFDAALNIAPDLAGALHIRGGLLSQLGRYADAIRDLERSIALGPDSVQAKATLLLTKMAACDWRGYEELRRAVVADVRRGAHGINPFAFLGVSDSPEDQLRCASTWIRAESPAEATALWTSERYRHSRIRIAYMSPDFREHPLGYLMAGLFERHDRNRFETIAVSFGPDTQSPMRTRLKAAFDRFVDAGAMSDAEVAALLRKMEVDIVIDRNGFTVGAQTGVRVLAHRPAPIHVSYLAFPGTMGAPYVDYLVADPTVLPPDEQRWYSEKVVYLPDSYYVNDDRRPIAARTPTRAESGLPDEGFVFCSFNNNYKITPAMFDVWMRLLKAVDGSVLWLLEASREAPDNLRREAMARGVAPERLVFAPRMYNEPHLARHRLADLFLDTLPYNAHTTACDALWAGLPVVTSTGTTFVGRVATSLLHAVGLPELITGSLDDYEALARELARDRERLAAIRDKLARHRDRYPLFDTDRFRRHLEAAYLGMWERWQHGEAPAPFVVSPID